VSTAQEMLPFGLGLQEMLPFGLGLQEMLPFGLGLKRAQESMTVSPRGSVTDGSKAAVTQLRHSQSSDNRSEKLANTRGKRHRQGPPECHSGSGTHNVCTARLCSNRPQKGEKA